MKPPLKVWVATRRAELRGRWESFLLAQGWACAFLEDLDELKEGLASPGPHAALIDLALGPDPAALAAWGVSYLLFGDLEGRPVGEIVRLLERGADDVLPAALDGRLLAAKLKAHFRGLLAPGGQRPGVLVSPKRTLKVDLREKRAWRRSADGRWSPVAGLTGRELDILGLLLSYPGAPLERRFILETLWRGQAEDVHSDTVNKHVQALRKKLAPHGASIRTLYGVGYAYREEG